MVEKFIFKKNCLIFFLIFIFLFCSLSVIHASEDSSEDFIISDSVNEENDSLMDVFVDSSYDDEMADFSNNGESIDDVDDNFLRGESNGEYDSYLEDIHNANSERYFSFISHLINDSGFEFRDSSYQLDGYFLYSTSVYDMTLFDGSSYSILPDEYYFASTNDRLGYFVNGMYFDDMVYSHNDNYYLDEEYLSWLLSNDSYASNSFSFDDITNGELINKDISDVNERNVVSNFPSQYDLRDYGYVSPVKDQGNTGNCWAFAAMSALESYLLKFENTAYNLSSYWDLSENNLKNVMSSIGRNGTDFPVNDGGTIFMALAYLLRWSGPVYEHDDPYGSNYNISSEDLNPIKHVQGVKLIPYRTNPLDNDIIKEAIMQYGGVVLRMYWDNEFLNNSSYCFYYKDNYNSTGEGHAVTVIGCYDNYSRYNFKASTPCADGPFIIKNSWGESSGDQGYYYISYYDLLFGKRLVYDFTGFAFTNVSDIYNLDFNYNYCPLGLNYWYGFGNSDVKFANQWISGRNEVLKSFGLYVKCQSNCSVDVYVDGVKVGLTTSRIFNDPGFYSVDLAQDVFISEGQTFRIEVSLHSLVSGEFDIIPLERNYDVYSNAYAGVNQSFIWNTSGGVYQAVDLTSKYKNANICLHAYTEALDGLVGTSILANNLVMDFNSSVLSARLVDENNVPLAGKSVYFNYHGNIYSRITDANGSFELTIRLNPGTYEILAAFDGDSLYQFSSRVVRVTVNKLGTNINQNVSTCYYKEFLGLTLRDNNGKALSGQRVAFLFNDKIYNRTTDDEGKAGLRINLKNGTYSFTIRFPGTSGYYSSNKTFNLVVNKVQARVVVSSYNTTYNSTENYTVQLINNITNKVIDGVDICFKVYMTNSYKEYNRTTNANGIAQMDLSRMILGSHNVQIFSKDSNVVFSTVSNNAVVNRASTIISAPSVSYKKGTNNYFRVTVRHQSSNNIVAGLKITLKIYTGSSYSLYNVTTNANGVASFNTKNLAVGNHNVIISSASNNYHVTGTSSIQITN